MPRSQRCPIPSDTLIICGKCGAQIPRVAPVCPKCGCHLSSSQIKASQLREMTPNGFREVARNYLDRLEKRPQTPWVESLIRIGEGFEAEFYRWEERLPPNLTDRLDRLQAFSNWCSNTAKELRS